MSCSSTSLSSSSSTSSTVTSTKKRSHTDNESSVEVAAKRKPSLAAPAISSMGRYRNSYNTISLGYASEDEYRAVSIQGMYCAVHIVVALHFIGEPPNDKSQVDHIDRNRSNNAVDNLRYVTKKENANNCKPKYAPMARKPVEAKKVTETDDCWVQYESFTKAAELLGCKLPSITGVCQGRLTQTGGYNFRYPDCVTKVFDDEEFREVGSTGTEVSNYGRLRNRAGHIRTGCKAPHGYVVTVICGEGYLVHRLVATVFSDLVGIQPTVKHTVDHKDRDKANNHFSNLQWLTPSEQGKRACETKRTKVRNNLKRIRGRKVGAEEWVEYESASAAAKKLGLRSNSIFRITSGFRKSYHGFEFQTVETPDLPGEVWKDIDVDLIRKHRRVAVPVKEIPK